MLGIVKKREKACGAMNELNAIGFPEDSHILTVWNIQGMKKFIFILSQSVINKREGIKLKINFK